MLWTCSDCDNLEVTVCEKCWPLPCHDKLPAFVVCSDCGGTFEQQRGVSCKWCSTVRTKQWACACSNACNTCIMSGRCEVDMSVPVFSYFRTKEKLQVVFEATIVKRRGKKIHLNWSDDTDTQWSLSRVCKNHTIWSLVAQLQPGISVALLDDNRAVWIGKILERRETASVPRITVRYSDHDEDIDINDISRIVAVWGVEGVEDGEEDLRGGETKCCDEFMCPISHERMTDPVVTPMGHSFDKKNIEKWLKNHRTCPLTRKALQLSDLYPNRALLAALEDKNKKKNTPSTTIDQKFGLHVYRGEYTQASALIDAFDLGDEIEEVCWMQIYTVKKLSVPQTSAAIKRLFQRIADVKKCLVDRIRGKHAAQEKLNCVMRELDSAHKRTQKELNEAAAIFDSETKILLQLQESVANQQSLLCTCRNAMQDFETSISEQANRRGEFEQEIAALNLAQCEVLHQRFSEQWQKIVEEE